MGGLRCTLHQCYLRCRCRPAHTYHWLSWWCRYWLARLRRCGLLFDIFYSGLIGISMIGFPLTVWLASKLQRYLPTSFMSSVAVWFVSMSMYLVFDYAGFGIINLTNLNIPDFIIFHMFPTLIINLMLLVLVYGLLNYWYHATRQPDISAYNVDDSDLNGRLPSLNSKSRSRSIR